MSATDEAAARRRLRAAEAGALRGDDRAGFPGARADPVAGARSTSTRPGSPRPRRATSPAFAEGLYDYASIASRDVALRVTAASR